MPDTRHPALPPLGFISFRAQLSQCLVLLRCLLVQVVRNKTVGRSLGRQRTDRMSERARA